MDNLKKKLDSGADIEIQVANWDISCRLLKSVMRELERSQFCFGIKSDTKSLADLEFNDQVINSIKGIITRIISSDEIESILWECFKTTTYNGNIITKDLFDFDMKARGDYLVIMKEVLWYNLSPFFKNVGSMLTGIIKNTISRQQKST